MGWLARLEERERQDQLRRSRDQQERDRRRREEERAEEHKRSTGSYWPYDPPGESPMH